MAAYSRSGKPPRSKARSLFLTAHRSDGAALLFIQNSHSRRLFSQRRQTSKRAHKRFTSSSTSAPRWCCVPLRLWRKSVRNAHTGGRSDGRGSGHDGFGHDIVIALGTAVAKLARRQQIAPLHHFSGVEFFAFEMLHIPISPVSLQFHLRVAHCRGSFQAVPRGCTLCSTRLWVFLRDNFRHTRP